MGDLPVFVPGFVRIQQSVVNGAKPLEVVVDHPQTTYTHHALMKLAESEAVVVICGPDHLPAARPGKPTKRRTRAACSQFCPQS